MVSSHELDSSCIQFGSAPTHDETDVMLAVAHLLTRLLSDQLDAIDSVRRGCGQIAYESTR